MKLLFLPLSLCFAKEAVQISYSSPDAPSNAHYFCDFDDGLGESWVKTSGTKQDEDSSKYSGSWNVQGLNKDGLDGDNGLVLTTSARHAGIAANLEKSFDFSAEENEKFVVQYEVNFQDGIECGGAYVKLFADEEGLELANFHDKTRFSIMFGPDKCANDYKLHFILNFKNPNTGEYEEKHVTKKPDNKVLKEAYGDNSVHLYRLVVDRSTNNFEVFLDNKSVSKGNLLSDMTPAVVPPAEISDENDKKPEDWDDREQIDDPSDSKPEDWDEDAPKKIIDDNAKVPSDWREDLEPTIEDPEAVMPDDWDEEMDGEYEAPRIPNPECEKISGCGAWESPLIDNPKYKGKWYPKQIKNPDYQGEWKAKMIENPAYFETNNVFNSITPIKAVALELWTMSKDIYFDNFYIGNSVDAAAEVAKNTFNLKLAQKKANEPSLAEKAKDAVSGMPSWLMPLIAIVVGIPVIYLVYAFFIKKAPTEEEKMKKDDDYRPETIEEEQEDAEEVSEEEVVEEEGQGDAEEAGQEDDEEEEEAEENDDESESEEVAKPATRTRRARKAD